MLNEEILLPKRKANKRKLPLFWVSKRAKFSPTSWWKIHLLPQSFVIACFFPASSKLNKGRGGRNCVLRFVTTWPRLAHRQPCFRPCVFLFCFFFVFCFYVYRKIWNCEGDVTENRTIWRSPTIHIQFDTWRSYLYIILIRLSNAPFLSRKEVARSPGSRAFWPRRHARGWVDNSRKRRHPRPFYQSIYSLPFQSRKKVAFAWLACFSISTLCTRMNWRFAKATS